MLTLHGRETASCALTNIGIDEYDFLACQSKRGGEVTADERLAFSWHGACEHYHTRILVDERHVEAYHAECLGNGLILLSVNDNLGVEDARLAVRNFAKDGNRDKVQRKRTNPW